MERDDLYQASWQCAHEQKAQGLHVVGMINGHGYTEANESTEVQNPRRLNIAFSSGADTDICKGGG